jgi:uncharacterized protein (DUF1778 family)
MKKKPKQASGGARLTASGKRPMLLGWPQEQAELIQAAALADGRKMTQFVMFHALQAAKKMLEKPA